MKHDDLCPWQAGPILASPIRRLLHNPARILSPYVSEGMTAMDIGCGMGYFTLPMAALAGKSGKVIAVDLQPEMLRGLGRKAAKAGIANIRPHQCAQTSLRIGELAGSIDFALIFWMLHEVPDPERLIREVRAALTDGGRLLFVEPILHVNGEMFRQSLRMLVRSGFTQAETPKVAVSRVALLRKV